MISVFNNTEYLTQALDSVVTQGFSPDEMQIEVVDDCSARTDPERIVKERYRDRVSFYRHSQRVGMAANWNACINRAKGRLVHILHQDDFVAGGYYKEIESLACRYPGAGLYSTRSFFVDDSSIINGVTERVLALEECGNTVEPFFIKPPFNARE